MTKEHYGDGLKWRSNQRRSNRPGVLSEGVLSEGVLSEGVLSEGVLSLTRPGVLSLIQTEGMNLLI